MILGLGDGAPFFASIKFTTDATDGTKLAKEPSAAPTGTTTVTLSGTGTTDATGAVVSGSTSVKLTASGATATGTLSYKWFGPDGKEITKGVSTTTNTGDTLTLDTYKDANKGTYTAKPYNTESGKNPTVGAADTFGTKTLSTTKIEQPTPVTVALKGTAEKTSISVNVAGGNGTGMYKVAYVAKGATAPTIGAGTWVTATGGTAKITGLTAETEYDVYAYRVGDGDYNDSVLSAKTTIKTAEATAPDIKVTNNEHIYDGTAKTAAVAVTVEGKTVTPDSITYGGAANQTNANEAGYEIVVTVGGKTYTPAEKLVINKAPVTITFSEAAAGKTLADVKKDLTGVVEADKADVTLNGFTWTDGDTTTIAAGQEYAWTATLTGTKAANYELEITPLKINAVGSGIVIGGSKQTYTVTYNVGSHGNFSSDASTTEKVAKNETPKNVPVVHPHDNYRFMGWTLDGKTVVDPTTQKITKNVTFTALYEACDHMAYMVGRSDTQFAPNGNLTRAEAATILSRLTEGFDENGTYPAAPYSDLNTSAWYAKYVNFAASKGIVNGRPDGTFDPDASITRAEFATMIANFAGVGRVEAPSASNDVAGHWAAGYIVALERANIVTGYEDGTFRPNANITRAEAATMVNGAIDRTPDTALDLAANSYTNPFTDVTAGQWFFAQVMEATVNHVTAHFHTDK